MAIITIFLIGLFLLWLFLTLDYKEKNKISYFEAFGVSIFGTLSVLWKIFAAIILILLFYGMYSHLGG
jgi:hypothetical protein